MGMALRHTISIIYLWAWHGHTQTLRHPSSKATSHKSPKFNLLNKTHVTHTHTHTQGNQLSTEHTHPTTETLTESIYMYPHMINYMYSSKPGYQREAQNHNNHVVNHTLQPQPHATKA